MANNAETSRILDLCLDRVLRKGESVEACLRDYPNQAGELGPLLRMAVDVRQVGQYTPIPTGRAKAAARMALHQAMQARGVGLRSPSPWRSVLARTLTARRWAVVATTAALFVVMASSGVVAASSGSQPDQALYPVKRTVERARLAFERDPQLKARLHAALADRRMEEMTYTASKDDRRRTEDLRHELEENLDNVRIVILPGQGMIVAEPGGHGQVPPQRPRPDMRQFQGRDLRQAKEMQRLLQAHAQMVEKRYQKFLREAPEPEREDLRQMLKKAREDYQDLERAFRQAYEAEVEESEHDR